MKHALVKSLLIACAALAQPGIALADVAEDQLLHPYLTNGLFVDVGIFYARRDVMISVNGADGSAGEFYDLESTFGGDKDDRATAIELGWRFGKIWSLTGQYFKFSSASRTTLSEEIEFQDEVFPVGANVDFDSSLSVTRIFFGRQFKYTQDRAEFGVGGGLHWLSIASDIWGDVFIGGATSEFRAGSTRAEGPLPNIGIWYRYSLTPRLAFRTRFDWFEASIDRYDGKLINFGIGLNYQFLDWLGAGINYNYFELDVGIDDDDWVGSIDSEYSGVFVNLSGFF